MVLLRPLLHTPHTNIGNTNISWWSCIPPRWTSPDFRCMSWRSCLAVVEPYNCVITTYVLSWNGIVIGKGGEILIYELSYKPLKCGEILTRSNAGALMVLSHTSDVWICIYSKQIIFLESIILIFFKMKRNGDERNKLVHLRYTMEIV